MMKSQVILVVASALFLVALVDAAPPQFTVEGKVYCDTCRAHFITRVSVFLQGAKIRLECRNITGSSVPTYSVDGITDKYGRYNLIVSGDHEKSICDVVLVQSPMPDCTEIPKGADAARISLTSNNGVVERQRHANPLAFFNKDPLPQCNDVLTELNSQ